MKFKSTVQFDGYSAVIPHIQNVYGPEKDVVGWCIGFKYTSGVFEFFSFKKKSIAEREHKRLLKAIDEYWEGDQ